MDRQELDRMWREIKGIGSKHYKTDGGVEQIDVFKAMGTLRDWVCAEISAHALRNFSTVKESISEADADKIMHYGMILKYLVKEQEFIRNESGSKKD
jgi:hypothetical protein